MKQKLPAVYLSRITWCFQCKNHILCWAKVHFTDQIYWIKTETAVNQLCGAMLIFPCWTISQEPPFRHLCRRKSLLLVLPWEMGIILQGVKKNKSPASHDLHLLTLIRAQNMRVHRQINCQQDYPAAFKDIALINTFLKKYLCVCVHVCPFLQDLSQGNPHSPWVVNPPASSLWRTGSSVGLRSPRLRIANQLKVYLHNIHFLTSSHGLARGQQVKDNHFFIPCFFPNFVSLLPAVKWVISAFLVLVEQMLSPAGDVPSCRKIWGQKISSVVHYICVNPLFCFSFLLRGKGDSTIAKYFIEDTY